MKKIIPIALLSLVVLMGVFYKNRVIDNSEKKTLKLEIGNSLKSLDPAIAFNDDSLSVVGQALDTLYQYHYLKRPYEIIPSLASGMPIITQGGRRYTIKIKKGIFYHDQTSFFKEKREIHAKDFELQIKRLAYKPLKSVGSWLFSGKIKGFDLFTKKVGSDFKKFLIKKIDGVTVLDKYTLQIDLLRPEPNLLYFLSMTFTSPVPEELVVKYNNDLSQVLVGTGAYFLKEIGSDFYYFEKNKNFRAELYPSSGDRFANTQDLLRSSSEKLPFVNSVTFHVMKNENLSWEKFMRGELDILSVPKGFLSKISDDPSRFEDLKKENNFDVKYSTTISSRWLGFNMKDPVIGKNKDIRRAIAHSINFSKYIEILSNNTNLSANSIYNPSIPGYNPSFKKSYYYSPDLAMKYIKSSGIDIKKFELTYSTRGNQEINLKEANFIKEELARVGIKLKIQILTFSEFIKKGRAGDIQFFTDQWIYDYPDAENILQLLISKNSPGINKSGYKNERVDKLYQKLSTTLDKKNRVQIMNEVERIVDDEVPWIMLMYESSYILHSRYIQNFRRSFFIRNYLKYLKKE